MEVRLSEIAFRKCTFLQIRIEDVMEIVRITWSSRRIRQGIFTVKSNSGLLLVCKYSRGCILIYSVIPIEINIKVS